MIADMRRLGVDVSRFAAALTVFAFGGNVDIAAYTAGNTAQNNMLSLLFFALDAAGVIWTAYDIYNTISEIQEAIENGQDPSTIVQEKLVDLAFSLSLGKIQKSVIAAKSTVQLIINIRKHLEDVAPYLVTKFDDLARQLSKMADGTQPDTGTGLNPETADVNHWVPGTDGKIVGDVAKYAVKDFPEVASKISQKQMRHIAGRKEYRGGGVLNSIDDAQKVLDSYKSGAATIIGKNKQGFPIVRYDGVTGTNINASAGITNQPTNIFMIKGTKSPSVVPINPNWKP